MANISPKIVFGILFFTLSDVNIDFLNHKLRWKTYTIQEALLTTRHIKLIEKKLFVAITLNPEYETFVIYIIFFSFVTSISFILLDIDIYPSCRL